MRHSAGFEESCGRNATTGAESPRSLFKLYAALKRRSSTATFCSEISGAVISFTAISCAIFCAAISSTVFLRLPQGSLPLHSFCTSGSCFSIAARNFQDESGFTENVAFSKLAD
jgi:hypothetical protein